MNGVLPIAANLRRYGGHSDAVGSGELAGLPPEARSCLTRAKGGGEGGIRTPVPLAGQDAFEAPPLRPLRYLSRPVGEPQFYCDPPSVENLLESSRRSSTPNLDGLSPRKGPRRGKGGHTPGLS